MDIPVKLGIAVFEYGHQMVDLHDHNPIDAAACMAYGLGRFLADRLVRSGEPLDPRAITAVEGCLLQGIRDHAGMLGVRLDH